VDQILALIDQRTAAVQSTADRCADALIRCSDTCVAVANGIFPRVDLLGNNLRTWADGMSSIAAEMSLFARASVQSYFPVAEAMREDATRTAWYVRLASMVGVGCAALPFVGRLFGSGEPRCFEPCARQPAETVNRLGVVAGALLGFIALVVGPFIGAKAAQNMVKPIQDLLKNVWGATWVVGFFQNLMAGTAAFDDIPESGLKELQSERVNCPAVVTPMGPAVSGGQEYIYVNGLRRWKNCGTKGLHPNDCDASCLEAREYTYQEQLAMLSQLATNIAFGAEVDSVDETVSEAPATVANVRQVLEDVVSDSDEIFRVPTPQEVVNAIPSRLREFMEEEDESPPAKGGLGATGAAELRRDALLDAARECVPIETRRHYEDNRGNFTSGTKMPDGSVKPAELFRATYKLATTSGKGKGKGKGACSDRTRKNNVRNFTKYGQTPCTVEDITEQDTFNDDFVDDPLFRVEVPELVRPTMPDTFELVIDEETREVVEAGYMERVSDFIVACYEGSLEKIKPVALGSVAVIRRGAAYVRDKMIEHPKFVQVAAVAVGTLVACVIGNQVHKMCKNHTVSQTFAAGAGVAATMAVQQEFREFEPEGQTRGARSNARASLVKQGMHSQVRTATRSRISRGEARNGSSADYDYEVAAKQNGFDSAEQMKRYDEMWSRDIEAQFTADDTQGGHYVKDAEFARAEREHRQRTERTGQWTEKISPNRYKNAVARRSARNFDRESHSVDAVLVSSRVPIPVEVEKEKQFEKDLEKTLLSPMHEILVQMRRPTPLKQFYAQAQRYFEPQNMLGSTSPVSIDRVNGVYRLIKVDPENPAKGIWISCATHVSNKLIVPTHALEKGARYRAVNFAGNHILEENFYPFQTDLSYFHLNSVKSPGWKVVVPTLMEEVLTIGFYSSEDKSVRIASGPASPNGYHRVPTQPGCCGAPLINNNGQIIGFVIGGDTKINAYVPVTAEAVEVISSPVIKLSGMDFPLRRQLSPYSTSRGQNTRTFVLYSTDDVSRDNSFVRSVHVEEDAPKLWCPMPQNRAVRFEERVYKHPLMDKWLNPYVMVPVFTMRVSSSMKHNWIEEFDLEEFELENDLDCDDLRDEWGISALNGDAALKSAAKYQRGRPTLPKKKQVLAFNKAVGMMKQHFGPWMMGADVISQDEAIMSLDMTTSCGKVWSNQFKTKKEFFDWGGAKPWLSEDWIRLLVQEDYLAIYGNALKEELRLVEKIEENSTRTFTAGPVEMTVHGNRLFLHQNQMFYASHLCTSSTVGLNTWRGGWDQLIKKLSFFQNGYALDESAYDSSLFNAILWAVAEFRADCLAKPTCHFPVEHAGCEECREYLDNQHRVKVYYRNLIHTCISLFTGTVVMKNGGNPSGSCNTIVDNTLCLYILLAYAWCRTAPAEMQTYEIFDDHTRFALCGDDNTWTVSDEAHVWYNGKSVIEVWKELEIVTTTDTLEPRKPEDLDYLSATTMQLDGLWVPRYNTKKLMSSLKYSKKPGPPMKLVKAAALFMVGYTNVAFREYVRLYIQFLLRKYSFLDQGDDALCVEWRAAKQNLTPDQNIRALYTGRPREERLFEFYALSWCEGRVFSLVDGNFVGQPSDEIYCEICGYPWLQCVCEDTDDDEEHDFSGGDYHHIPKSLEVYLESKKEQRQIKEIKMPRVRKNKSRTKKKGPAMPKRRGMPFSEQQKIAIMMGGVAGKDNGRRPNRPPKRKARRPQRGGGLRNGGFRANRNSNMNGKKGRIVQEDEYIGEILGSNSSTVPVIATYPLNPGQSATFPWLASQSPSWEQWECLSCEFYTKPEVSQYATGGQTGKVILVHKYNSADGPPATKQQAEDTVPHADGMAHVPIFLKLQPSLMHPAAGQAKKLVRPKGLPGGGDITNYDGGNLTVMTLNNGTTSAIGELHVRYIFRLLTPVLEGATYVAPANNQVALFQSTTTEAAAASGTPATLLLATATTNGVGAVNTAGSIVLPVGNYLLDATATAYNAAGANDSLTLDLQKDGVSLWQGTHPPASQNNAGQNLTSVSQGTWVSCNGTNAITLVATSLYTGTTVWDGMLRITAM